MNYAKTIVMVLVSGLVALQASLSGGVSTSEWVTVLIALTGAAAVFTAPNVPGARYTKVILAVLAAVLAFLVSAVAGGLDTNEYIQVLILAAGAVGVYAAPYTPQLSE